MARRHQRLTYLSSRVLRLVAAAIIALLVGFRPSSGVAAGETAPSNALVTESTVPSLPEVEPSETPPASPTPAPSTPEPEIPLPSASASPSPDPSPVFSPSPTLLPSLEPEPSSSTAQAVEPPAPSPSPDQTSSPSFPGAVLPSIEPTPSPAPVVPEPLPVPSPVPESTPAPVEPTDASPAAESSAAPDAHLLQGDELSKASSDLGVTAPVARTVSVAQLTPLPATALPAAAPAPAPSAPGPVSAPTPVVVAEPPAAVVRRPLALIAGSPPSLDLPKELAIMAVPAVAPSVAHSAVQVAVDFGKSGSGWAATVVFNLWLRRQLRERRISQRQLAMLSGVDHSTISRLLRGDRAPTLETATKLAHALRQVAQPDEAPLYFDRLAETTIFPTQRVEAALLGDDELEDTDVRSLMQAYLALRARRRRARRLELENGGVIGLGRGGP